MHIHPDNRVIVTGGRISFESDAARQGVCKGSRMANLIRRSNAKQAVVQRRQSVDYEIVI